MPCCDCCCPDGEECCKAPGPDGICCDPERCCGTEEEPVCCPEGEYCCDGECQEEPCEESAGACCELDGTCTQKTQAACEEGGGFWHGADTDCDSYDCEEFGCAEVPSACSDNLQINHCVPGGTFFGACDPDLPQARTTGNTPCEPDRTQATLVFSGYVSNTGDAALDARIDALANDTYVLDLDCAPGATDTFTDGDLTAIVTVGFSGTAAILVVQDVTLITALMQFSDPQASPAYECTASVADCSDFNANVVNWDASPRPNAGDGSAGTVDVS